MRFIFTLLSIFCFASSLNAQSKLSSVDSLKIEINTLNQALQKINLSNDSLSKEVNKNLVKVDFYVGRYSDLSTQFQWFTGILVAFIVAIGSLVVWRFYSEDIKAVKEGIALQRTELENLIQQEKENMRQLRSDQYRQNYVMLSNTVYFIEMDIIIQLHYYLAALRNMILAYKSADEAEKEVYLDSLLTAINSCLKVSKFFLENDIDIAGSEKFLTPSSLYITKTKPYILECISFENEELQSNSIILLSDLDKVKAKIHSLVN